MESRYFAVERDSLKETPAHKRLSLIQIVDERIKYVLGDPHTLDVLEIKDGDLAISESAV